MKENVAVVIDHESIAIYTQLKKIWMIYKQNKPKTLSVTLWAGTIFLISLIGTSVPTTPKSCAVRAWKML